MAALNPLRRSGAIRKTGALIIALVAALWLAGLRVGAAPAPQEAPISPLLLPISPLLASSLPSLEGTVVLTGSDAPLAGIEITAYQNESNTWRPVRRTTTNAVGYYRFPRMSAGVYRLLADDPADRYAPIYYPAAPQVELAANVPVMAQPVTGINLAVAPAGTISGTVTWTNGPTPFNVEVFLYRWRETNGPTPDAVANNALADYWEVIGGVEELVEAPAPATTTGTVITAPIRFDYGFHGLSAGIYRVCVLGSGLDETRSECYDDALLGTAATAIVPAAGETITGIDIDLGTSAAAAQMTGLVTTPDGTPAAGVEINLLPVGSQNIGPVAGNEQTSTDANGVYTFTRLLPVGYTITLNDLDDGRYLPLTYSTTEAATEAVTETGTETGTLVITPTATTPSIVRLNPGETHIINAIVTPAAIISGYVTLDGSIPGINGQVYALPITGAEGAQQVTANIDPATGAFRIPGLESGTYALQVLLQPPGSNLSFFVGGADQSQATPYQLASGEQITDVSIDVTPAYDALPFGQITGTVTLEGTPLPGIRVAFYRTSDRNRVPPPTIYVETDAEGRYHAVNLPPGEYLIGFVDPGNVYATVYYPNQPVLALAQSLTIGLPEPDRPNKSFAFGNIDARLVPAGSIARTAQRSDGTPLVNTEVVLFRSLGEQGFARQGTTRTDAEGVYRFGGLLPGSYRACIVAAGAGSQECLDLGVQAQAFTINVLAGVASTGIDTVP